MIQGLVLVARPIKKAVPVPKVLLALRVRNVRNLSLVSQGLDVRTILLVTLRKAEHVYLGWRSAQLVQKTFLVHNEKLDMLRLFSRKV